MARSLYLSISERHAWSRDASEAEREQGLPLVPQAE